MISFNTSVPDNPENSWRYQLNDFVAANQLELAALAWGLWQEWGDSQDILGIDIQPKPHFIRCSKESIEKLNNQVGNRIQEILGIIDGYKPEEEVVIIAIGNGQVKLINFQPQPFPPECFESIEVELDTLIETLEKELGKQF